jgi:ankyrin repeat protein
VLAVPLARPGKELIVTARIPPTRTLRARPDLNQLRRQAKELLEAFRAGEAEAVAEVNARFRGADAATFALHDAQLVLARSYGFDSWPKLKAFVDGATVRRLAEAVRAGDLSQARALLEARPELARMGIDNHQVLHFAVADRNAEMVRLLMRHGADAREGVYPHRDATGSLTIASERGYDEIVDIIRDEERRRREARSGQGDAPAPDDLFRAIGAGEDDRAIAMMEADPALIRTSHPDGWRPLHAAARRLNPRLVAWLLDHGAEADPLARDDLTPLDLAAHGSADDTSGPFAAVAAALLGRGAALTAPAAVALGDAGWLRARNAEAPLVNPIEDSGGLLRIAASHGRPEILTLLLDLGLDPDERLRLDGGDDPAFSWGMPLYHCAGAGKYEMAEILLRRGADPNGRVCASGSPMFQAYSRRDWAMVELLQRYGGAAEATTAGLFRQTELARRMLAGEADYRMDGVGGDTLAEQLLWGSACGGDPEIVRMALERVDWPRDDRRWFHILEQPLRIWNHGSPAGDNPEWDRGTYLACIGLILDRCDANLLGRVGDEGRFGLTILHSVAGARTHVTAEERRAFATMLLDAGARLDLRDNLLRSTPLGWACRWGRVEMVELFLGRGADPTEADAEPWATPRAWAEKMGHGPVLAILRAHGG